MSPADITGVTCEMTFEDMELTNVEVMVSILVNSCENNCISMMNHVYFLCAPLRSIITSFLLLKISAPSATFALSQFALKIRLSRVPFRHSWSLAFRSVRCSRYHATSCSFSWLQPNNTSKKTTKVALMMIFIVNLPKKEFALLPSWKCVSPSRVFVVG